MTEAPKQQPEEKILTPEGAEIRAERITDRIEETFFEIAKNAPDFTVKKADVAQGLRLAGYKFPDKALDAPIHAAHTALALEGIFQKSGLKLTLNERFRKCDSLEAARALPPEPSTQPVEKLKDVTSEEIEKSNPKLAQLWNKFAESGWKPTVENVKEFLSLPNTQSATFALSQLAAFGLIRREMRKRRAWYEFNVKPEPGVSFSQAIDAAVEVANGKRPRYASNGSQFPDQTAAPAKSTNSPKAPKLSPEEQEANRLESLNAKSKDELSVDELIERYLLTNKEEDRIRKEERDSETSTDSRVVARNEARVMSSEIDRLLTDLESFAKRCKQLPKDSPDLVKLRAVIVNAMNSYKHISSEIDDRIKRTFEDGRARLLSNRMIAQSHFDSLHLDRLINPTIEPASEPIVKTRALKEYLRAQSKEAEKLAGKIVKNIDKEWKERDHEIAGTINDLVYEIEQMIQRGMEVSPQTVELLEQLDNFEGISSHQPDRKVGPDPDIGDEKSFDPKLVKAKIALLMDSLAKDLAEFIKGPDKEEYVIVKPEPIPADEPNPFARKDFADFFVVFERQRYSHSEDFASEKNPARIKERLKDAREAFAIFQELVVEFANFAKSKIEKDFGRAPDKTDLLSMNKLLQEYVIASPEAAKNFLEKIKATTPELPPEDVARLQEELAAQEAELAKYPDKAVLTAAIAQMEKRAWGELQPTLKDLLAERDRLTSEISRTTVYGRTIIAALEREHRSIVNQIGLVEVELATVVDGYNQAKRNLDTREKAEAEKKIVEEKLAAVKGVIITNFKAFQELTKLSIGRIKDEILESVSEGKGPEALTAARVKQTGLLKRLFSSGPEYMKIGQSEAEQLTKLENRLKFELGKAIFRGIKGFRVESKGSPLTKVLDGHGNLGRSTAIRALDSVIKREVSKNTPESMIRAIALKNIQANLTP